MLRPSPPRTTENPLKVSAGFRKTRKEQLLWVQYFATIKKLQVALQEFKHRYNTSSLDERHGFVSAAAARPAPA